MRVRISYSVELEEVPAEYSRLLKEAADLIGSAAMIMKNIQDGNIPKEATLQNLEQIRATLSKIDYKILDTGMILNGYYDACKQIEESQKEIGPEPKEEPNDITEG
tara:strand:+ start:281 stop:598 length:318 start_codon:yes stop_codon:yes gene_type:complete